GSSPTLLIPAPAGGVRFGAGWHAFAAHAGRGATPRPEPAAKAWHAPTHQTTTTGLRIRPPGATAGRPAPPARNIRPRGRPSRGPTAGAGRARPATPRAVSAAARAPRRARGR